MHGLHIMTKDKQQTPQTLKVKLSRLIQTKNNEGAPRETNSLIFTTAKNA